MIKDSRDLVFSAVNFHAAGCETPPAIRDDGTSSRYYGYFANCHGEQWVCTIDPQTKTGILRGGDIGWETEVQITNGRVDDLILGAEERQWLDACWRAACGEPLKA